MKRLTLILIILFNGCGEDNFKKYASLNDFRVLGIVADKPEVSDTNETVALTVIASDIENEGRTITQKIEGCVDPGISAGEEISCEGAQKYQLIGESDVDLNAELGGSFYTGALPSVNVTVPSDILSNRTVIEQFNGVDYLIVYTFSIDGSEVLQTFKRVKVSSRVTKNSNPQITSLSSLSLNSDDQTLSVVINEDAESFTYLDLLGDQNTSSEVYYLSWFTSSGEIENSQVYVEEETKINLGSSLPDEAVVVVFLRDGRGGVDFQVKNLP